MGRFNHEKVAKKIGQIIIATRTDRFLTQANGVWSGFIRQESINWWLDRTDVNSVAITAESFNEQGLEFNLGHYSIVGYQLAKNVTMNGRLVGKADSIKIITRKAQNDFERGIHSRWPMTVSLASDNTWRQDIKLFTSKDIIKGQAQLF